MSRRLFEIEPQLRLAGCLVKVPKHRVGDGIGFVQRGGDDDGRGFLADGSGALGPAARHGGAEIEPGYDLRTENGLQIPDDLAGKRIQMVLPDGVFTLDDQRRPDEAHNAGVDGNLAAHGHGPRSAGQCFWFQDFLGDFQLADESAGTFHLGSDGIVACGLEGAVGTQKSCPVGRRQVDSG